MDEVLEEPRYRKHTREVIYEGPHQEVGVVSVEGQCGMVAKGTVISVFVSHPQSVESHIAELVKFNPLINYLRIDPRDDEMKYFQKGLMDAWRFQLEYVRNSLAQRNHQLLPVFSVNYVGIIPIVKQLS